MESSNAIAPKLAYFLSGILEQNQFRPGFERCGPVENWAN
jgi:hypothetical protein